MGCVYFNALVLPSKRTCETWGRVNIFFCKAGLICENASMKMTKKKAQEEFSHNQIGLNY